MNVRRTLGIVAIAVTTASCVLLSPSDDSTVTLEGIVYGSYVSNPGGGPVTYVNPVAGAVVSTSLDSGDGDDRCLRPFQADDEDGAGKGLRVQVVCLSAGWPEIVRGSGC